MQILRIKFLSLFFICFFLVRVVFAGTVVQTEFEMLLPRSFQQNLIEKQWKQYQSEDLRFEWSLPDQSYDAADVKVVLAGIKLNLKTQLEKPALGDQGDRVELRSKGLEAALNIGAVAVDQYIERVIGGVIVRVRVQARCDDVQLHMKAGQGALTMKLSPVFEQHMVRAQVEDANLTWTPEAWEMDVLNCTGAAGFEDLIRAEVVRRTGDASIVSSQKPVLMQYLRDYVNSKSLDLSKPRELVTSRPDIKVSMSISEFTGSQTNAVVRGLFRADFTRIKGDEEINFKLAPGSTSTSSTPLLRVPEPFVLAVTQRAFSGNTWVHRLSSKDVPGFSSLMRSRLTQFFVWRELTRFSKSAQFMFDVYSPKSVAVSGKNLNYVVKAPLYAKMYAPKSRKYVSFMNFSAPLNSQVKLSLNKGKVSAKFSKVKLGLEKQWDPAYVTKYRPYRTFARDLIRKRIVSAAEGKAFTYTLPPIPVADQMQLRLERVQTAPNGDLNFYLSGL